MPETLTKPYLKNVALIEPQNGIYTGFQGLVRTEPLGLEYIAGAICSLDTNQPRVVEEVTIFDDRLAPGEWREKMRQNPPDMIGIRLSYTADVPIVHKLVRDIREEVGSDIPVVIGGHHISLRPSDAFIDGVNAVVIGPGEVPMRDLVKAWAKDHSFESVRNIWYQNGEGEWQSNLSPVKVVSSYEFNSCQMDQRPLPRRDLVAKYRKMGEGYYFLNYPNVATMEMGRGCRFRCSFCSVIKFHHGRYEVESPNRTVSEILALPDDIKYVNFIDDLAFNSGIQWNPATGRRELFDPGMELADELIRLGMEDRIRFWAQVRTSDIYPIKVSERTRAREKFHKLAKVGLDMMLNGLESLNSVNDLKRINKGSNLATNIEAIRIEHEEGIRCWGAQIVFPDWTEEDYKRVAEINNVLKIAAPQFTILTELPGSDDYEEALKERKLITLNPANFDFFHWVTQTRLPIEETYRLIAEVLYQGTGSSFTSLDRFRADLKDGRTTMAATKVARAKFEAMRNPQTHIANIRQIDNAQEEYWQRFIMKQAARYGGPETALLEKAS